MKKEAAKLGVSAGYKLALWPYESGNKNTKRATWQHSSQTQD